MAENESTFVNIAGNQVKVFYDVEAMMDAEQTLQLMTQGLVNKDFFGLSKKPYNLREIGIMLMMGFNGQNRVDGIDKRYNFGEVQKLMQSHFAYISRTAKNETEKVKMLETLKDEISMAALKGMNLFMDSPTV